MKLALELATRDNTPRPPKGIDQDVADAIAVGVAALGSVHDG